MQNMVSLARSSFFGTSIQLWRNSCITHFFSKINQVLTIVTQSIITAPKRGCGNVMFSQVSVRQTFCTRGGGGPHVTITHHALGHGTYHHPPPFYWNLVVITGDLLKCVHLRTYCPPPPNWWSPEHIRLETGRYASYLNAFLFLIASKEWPQRPGDLTVKWCIMCKWSTRNKIICSRKYGR